MTQDDNTEDWSTIREAADAYGLEQRTIHALCADGSVPYQVGTGGAWIIHLPHLAEWLRHVTGFDRKPFTVRAVEYDHLLGHLARIEKKLDTIIEGEVRMTAADNQIEADVATLKQAFASLGTLISNLNTTVSTLQGEVANGGAPSAATLSDLDTVTGQINSLVTPVVSDPPATDPTDGGDTPPADGGPVLTPPDTGTDTGATGAGDVPPDSSPQPVDGTDPTSGGAVVGDPSSASDTPASVPDPQTPASPQSP